MIVDAFFSPYFPEKENLFDNSLVVMLDVLRASTTICSALYHGAKEVIPIETTEKAIAIYSSLSREIRFLGGERGGMKPAGFDAGNSPLEYSSENIKGKSVILTTTNGTVLFQKAKRAKYRIIGCFANLSVVLNKIKSSIDEIEKNGGHIFIICAGNNGRFSYEDVLSAGAFISELNKFDGNFNLTDAALSMKDLFSLHKDNIYDFLSGCEHPSYLKSIGLEEDIKLCLEIDKFPVVPIISGNSIKL